VTLSHFFYPAYPCATRHKTIVVKSRGGLRHLPCLRLWPSVYYLSRVAFNIRPVNYFFYVAPWRIQRHMWWSLSFIRRVSFTLEPKSTPALKSRATADIGYRSYAINW